MLLFLSAASSYEIRFERTRTRLREVVGNDSSTVDRDHMIVDSDVIEGDLNYPLPAGQKETIVIRVRPENYRSRWWYAVKVIHIGGRISRKSNLVQVAINYDPAVFAADDTTTTASNDQGCDSRVSTSPMMLYMSIGSTVVLLTILASILGLYLYHRRSTVDKQDNVEGGNVQIDNVLHGDVEQAKPRVRCHYGDYHKNTKTGHVGLDDVEPDKSMFSLFGM